MTQDQTLLDVTMSADSTEFAAMRAQLREVLPTLHFGEEDITAIILAVDEACCNITRHAYKGTPGEIRLQLTVKDGKLRILLSDKAPRVNPEQLQLKQPDIDRPGGLGLYLIHKVMDKVELVAPPGEQGNQLKMTKAITNAD